MKIKKVVIIGVGLIGGSIGKALREKALADEVVSLCRRQSSLDRAMKEGIFSGGFVNDYEEAVRGADIIFIATPVHTIEEVLGKLAEVINDKKVIVTDVGSTKKEVCEYAARFKDRFSFVGGHPLAGSEKTGVEYSSADLFESSLCVLTDGKIASENSVNILRELWQSMGAEVEIITPEEHDKILAFTSHLPHVAAYVLAGAQEEKFHKYVSTGFKDATRIASSDPVLWTDIIMSNRENMLRSIDKFKGLLNCIEEDIRFGRQEDLKEKLEKYKRMRDELD